MSDLTPDTLDKVALKQLTWKPSVTRNIAVSIVEQIILPPYKIWPDEISLGDVLLCDRHVVGIAWRLLSQAEVIKQTGNYRKSQSVGRNSGIVFEYELKSLARAQTFLKRNNRTLLLLDQKELFAGAT